MSDKPLSLRLLKLLLAIWWWGLLVGGAAGLLLMATLAPKNLNFPMIGYASDIDTSTLTAEDRSGQKLAVEFDGPTRVKLFASSVDDSKSLSTGHRVVSVFVLATYFALSLYFVKLLRDIVGTVDRNDPFVDENARRVRSIGILIIAYGMMESLSQLALSGYADSMVVPDGFNLNGRLELNVGLLVVGIAVVFLSEVFRHGARIREEQLLTV